MRRMTGTERKNWLGGTAKHSEQVSAAIRSGRHQCDECDKAAVAIGYGGSPVRVDVRCGPCFLRFVEGSRVNRPSRAELIAAASC